jgi:hypothetical protein
LGQFEPPDYRPANGHNLPRNRTFKITMRARRFAANLKGASIDDGSDYM